MKKVLIIKGFIAASIIAVLGQLTSCQNEDGFTQESTEKVNLIDYDVTKVPCEETEEDQPVSYTHLDVYKRQQLLR